MTQSIAVVQSLGGPTYLPMENGDVLALIIGVQVLASELATKAFEQSGLGHLLTVDEFISQPIAMVRSYLASGLSVEARDLLLASNPKAALKVELEARCD